ncbi:MAG: aquaporin [Omnitrophica WOR_2 bacterium GWA2_47_8]|nr:MAG: aquaporin [Omnitrophica WOR_2 bacterium GWA2_47_8]
MNKKALIAEFIGTFTLIFIGVGSIASNYLNGGETGLVGIALAHGLAIAVMVSATAAVSGGHLNPAVTIGLFSAKKINAANTVGYVIAQCLGGIAAAAMLKFCVPAEALLAVNMGTPSLAANVSPVMGCLLEVVLTFFLVFVVYGTGVDKRAPQVGGLFIGLAVTLDILVGGPITGAAMNPARHLGPALLGGGMENVWLYWLGPLLGGILAGTIYKKFLEK